MKIQLIDEHYFPKQYAGQLLMIDRGEGCYLYDSKGNKYLDFGSGIAVNALGYGREDLARIACEQMKKIIHVSNLYTTEPAVILSAKLAATGDFAAVHFGNSGSEANEAALKYARLYARRKHGPDKHKFACFTGAFHGRTMGALSCTPKEKYQDPFRPLLPGVELFPYNDLSALEKGLTGEFAAVIVEAVQGEGGLSVIDPEFAAGLRQLCTEQDIILIADEVQTGCGRTGEFYASSWAGLKPDIITLSKPLAGGLPLSATLIPEKINDILSIGDHGTTFGGGPVTTAVASYILDRIFTPAFLASVREKGEYLAEELTKLIDRHSAAKKVKGKGLLLGLEVSDEDKIPGIMEKCREEGLLILRSGTNVLRFAPPLILTRDEIGEGISILDKVLHTIK